MNLEEADTVKEPRKSRVEGLEDNDSGIDLMIELANATMMRSSKSRQLWHMPEDVWVQRG